MSRRVIATPAPGLKVRNPTDLSRHIAADGEVMIESLDLIRLRDAGDITLAPEAAAVAPSKKKD